MIAQRANRSTIATLMLTAVVAAATVAGCSSGGSDTSAAPSDVYDVVWQNIKCPCTTPKLHGDTFSADVGGGHVITWKKGEKLNIAEFDYGQQVPYNVAEVQGIRDAAKAAGANVTVFDAVENPATQRNQIQNALASGKFNAALVVAVDGQASCEQATRAIPSANIPVVVVANEVCGRDGQTGQGLWSPGTVAYVGDESKGLYSGFMRLALQQVNGSGEAIVVAGQEAVSVTKVFVQNVQEVAKANPQFKIDDVAYTDWTSATALTKTQNLLLAHPNATMVLLAYGGELPGVVQAVKNAGRSGKVKVFDIGGAHTDKAAIASGDLEMTTPFYPQTQGYCAVDMLASLHSGHAVPRVAVNMCHKTDGSPDVQNSAAITKANVASFQAQG